MSVLFHRIHERNELEKKRELKELEKIGESIVEKCMKCGFCTFTCPLYQETFEESDVARGKIALVREVLNGNLDFSNDIFNKIQSCLLCRSCVTNCSIHVATDRIILAARIDGTNHRGISPFERLLFRRLLPKRKLFGHAVRLASRLQKVIPQSNVSGTIRHLPDFLTGAIKGRNIPALPSKFLRDRIPEVNRPPRGTGVRSTVGFFSGCGLDFMYPGHGIDLIRFLTTNGVEVHFLKKQGCCGAPVLFRGHSRTAREMAARNVELFKDYDVILTACATCGSVLKEYADYYGGKEDANQFESFSARIVDINEYILDVLFQTDTEYGAGEEYAGKTVTWHDPCHLSRYQEIRNQPREILRRISNIEYVEMANADRCCGMGGSFSLYHYDLSQKIAQKKIESIKASGADIVATACPGCLLQLNDALKKNNMETKAVHIMNLFR